MGPRLDHPTNRFAGTLARHMVAASKTIEASTLPGAAHQLVLIRASRTNGCGWPGEFA